MLGRTMEWRSIRKDHLQPNSAYTIDVSTKERVLSFLNRCDSARRFHADATTTTLTALTSTCISAKWSLCAPDKAHSRIAQQDQASYQCCQSKSSLVYAFSLPPPSSLSLVDVGRKNTQTRLEVTLNYRNSGLQKVDDF